MQPLDEWLKDAVEPNPDDKPKPSYLWPKDTGDNGKRNGEGK